MAEQVPSSNFGDLGGDAWGCITPFACYRDWPSLRLVSRSMNALAWSTRERFALPAHCDADENFSECLPYLRKMPNLQALTISWGTISWLERDDPKWKIMASVFPKLTELDLNLHAEKGYPWTHFPGLTKLALRSNLYDITFPDTELLVHPSLMELHIQGPEHFPLRGTLRLKPISLFPNLTSLQYTVQGDEWDIQDYIPSHILVNLKEITFVCDELCEIYSFEKLTQCPNLTHLALKGCEPVSWSPLSSLKNLRRLETQDVGVTNEVIKSLHALKKLSEFRLYSLDRHNLEPFLSLTQLESLPVLDSSFSGPYSMKLLKHHTNLTRLPFIEGLVTRYDAHYLSRLTNLVDLCLSYTRANDNGVSWIQGLTRLTKLDLSDDILTNRGIGYLTRLTNLTDLCLYNSKIDDFGLRGLRVYPFLKHLDLRNCYSLTGRGLDKLTNLVHLEFLDLGYNPELKTKYISHLAKLNLKGLFLNGTPITDHALVHLKKMKALVELSIYYCINITLEGIAGIPERIQVAWEGDY